MDDLILLGHGSGGHLTTDLVRNLFLRNFKNALLEPLSDSARLPLDNPDIAFTTDSYIITPQFFLGGNIGSLAVHGTVNDIAMSGAQPLYLSAAYIIEEGFRVCQLEEIVKSMAQTAAEAGVKIVTGDTKVVPRGMADGLYINTSGIGVHRQKLGYAPDRIRKGDAIIVNGNIGDHGAAVLSSREEGFTQAEIFSDSAALNHLVAKLQDNNLTIHALRDATRGGVGGILTELAEQAKNSFKIYESRIPVQNRVRGMCEIYGFEPLFLANEGKMVLFCPAVEADKIIELMHSDPLGKNAAIIGEVIEEPETPEYRVIMETAIGGSRIIDQPAGELVPRIC